MNTWEYYRLLKGRGATYRPHQDVSDWITFNLAAYHEQARMVLYRLDQCAAVWHMLGPAHPDARIRVLLYDVAMSGRIRRARYERCADLTPRQAQRDLRELVTAGLLVEGGRGRARHYAEGPRFPEAVLERARTPFVAGQAEVRRQ